ncbi:SseB family protein [Sanguibacter hominis ATCC BAA-789]|uniref:SseB family protein n=1 Tax=Sanguibacter hominis ATCC BAA-789 TaxID=1312740 RepID=A0A9X5IN32_9MICO|nr:SseB family protein [Sanguibacter hominis ATCC BAA-789]
MTHGAHDGHDHGVPADSAGTPWSGRDLRSNPFAGDDGSCEPALAAALEAYASGGRTADLERVVGALASARVLVPIIAELDVAGRGEHGQEVDKEASAGVVALEAPDGRKALPVFSSVEAMTRWRADARPVPSYATRAALSAVQEGWALVVLDPGGPTTVLVPRPAVWALAQGRTWEPAVRDGVVDEAVRAAVRDAALPAQHVVRADAVPGRTAEVAVALGIDGGLDRAGLDQVLAWVNRALAASSVISERVDSLELRIGRA